MKRSELNEIIREGEKFIASFGFKLPEFANWSLDDWKRNKPRAGEVHPRAPRLGHHRFRPRRFRELWACCCSPCATAAPTT